MGDKKFEELPVVIQEVAADTLRSMLVQLGPSFLLKPVGEEEPAVKLARTVRKAFISLNRSLGPDSTKIDDGLIFYRIAEIIASQKNQD